MTDWTKVDLDLDRLCEELRKQDEQLNAILKRREEIRDIVKINGTYDELWEMLYSDCKSHWEF